jgi:hypothetical protein
MASEADFYIKEGDTSPPIRVQLLEDDGSSVNLTDALVNVKLEEVGGDSYLVNSPGIISAPSDGMARYEWADGDTSAAGYYNAVFEVEYDAVTNVTSETHTYSAGTDVYSLDNDRILVSGYYEVTIEDASGDTYTRETDFEVVDDDGDGDLDSIDWSIGGSSPDDAEDFDVDYSYQTNSSFSKDETFPNSQYIVVRIDEGL